MILEKKLNGLRNSNALKGSANPDLFSDAVALEEMADTDHSWREWPLLANDGDLATLVQLVSDNRASIVSLSCNVEWLMPSPGGVHGRHKSSSGCSPRN